MKRVVVLDNIRSTFNVGSVFRTADGAGVDKIYLAGITPTPDHAKIKKTALGAEKYVEWEHFKDIRDIISKLRSEGFKIYPVEQFSESKDFREIDEYERMAFVFGNEITGISHNLLELTDEPIEIPMRGKKNSLNVSTTVGIILYHFCR